MTIFQAKLVNLVGYGQRMKKVRTGGWVNDRFEFELDGKKIRIVQRAAVRTFDKSRFRGLTIPSSNVTISKVDSFHEGETLLNDLCWLLSFATHSPVMAYRYEYGGLVRGRDATHRYNSWRPPFDIGGPELATFINASWSHYQALKDSRALEGLIHLVVTSDAPGTLLETQVTTSVQCLECIKTYFVLSQGHRFKVFEQTNGTFKGRSAHETTFENLLRLALEDVGMRLPRDFEVIKKLRNAIVHRGFIREQDSITGHIFGALGPGAMHRTMFSTFEKIQDLIREYLLRLLAYQGQYRPYIHGGRAHTTIS